MTTLLFLLMTTTMTTGARADDVTSAKTRSSYLLGASLQLKWAAVTRRYPRVPAMEIKACGVNCFTMNGEPIALTPASESVARLTDAAVLGVRRDSSRPTLLLQTRRDSPVLIWATLSLRDRRLKFLGFDRRGADVPGEIGSEEGAARGRSWPEYLLELKALLEYSLGDLSPRELALDQTLPEI